jgi:adenylate kinase family enzyme
MRDERLPRRIAVVGTTGSGKTTLARKLAERLDIPHVELDSLHWEADWTPAPKQVFHSRVIQALDREAWTTDGNYSELRDITWGNADTVVWLDYPLPLVLSRVTRRTIRRWLRREVLWGNNQEQLRRTLLSRDSIILYALRTYRRRRREYPSLFRQAKYAHLRVVHLTSPRATQDWLLRLPEHVRQRMHDE